MPTATASPLAAVQAPVRPRIIASKFAGPCANCSTPIAVGDEIIWIKGAPTRHRLCPIVPRPIARCHCGSALSDGGACLDLALWGEHKDGSL